MSISDVTRSSVSLLGRNLASLDRVVERMATGRKLNRAADGPAAIVTAERLRAVLASIDAETRSIERAQSTATVADGAMASIGSMLADATALVVANANEAGLSPEERAANQAELDSLLAAVDAAAAASFNGAALLNGSFTISVADASLTLEATSTNELGALTVDGEDYVLSNLRSGGPLDLDGDPETAQMVLQAAVDDVATARGRLGAFQSATLDAAAAARRVAMEGLAASLSGIADADLATDIVELRVGQLAVKASILAVDAALETRSSVLDLLA